jgi:photosystem II stability/assembly factor-like uncharacterized protein
MSCLQSFRYFLFSFISIQLFAQKAPSQAFQPYNWKNVQIVGGGFVDGIIFHPKAKGLRYCRTDMGGAYRWNDALKQWEPLLDFLSYEDRNLMGVESIAVDPNDPGFVVIACGTYTNSRTGNGAILRSFDQGKTFERTNVPFKFGGNENGRGNGERMMVDPKNPNIIYLGTRLNGLWKSIDKGKTWEQIKTFPDVTEPIVETPGMDSIQRRAFLMNRGSGIVMTFFDSHNTSKEFSVVYAAASLMGRNNMFRSDDNGATWKAVPDQPTQYRPTHAVLAPDEMLYITYGDNPGPNPMTNGAVWKLNTRTGEWTDITPDMPSSQRKFGYAAVAVDVQHPKTIIVSTYNRYTSGGEEIFKSLDGGTTWKPVLKTQSKFDHSIAPYVGRTGVHWMFDLEIDPFNSNHAMFTTGYGGHETFNLTDVDNNKTVTWTVMSKGIEETVALELLSPPKGAHLISAIGDYGGFVHWNPDKPETNGNFTNPHFGNTDGVAFAEKNPGIIVRVGIASRSGQEKNIGYSLDGGKTWQPAENMPSPLSRHGHIAVSADGKTWIWTPQRSAVFVTHDQGKTWKAAKGIPENLKVVADKVNSKKFYALSLFEGKIYTSEDEGNSFIEQSLPDNIKIPKRGILRGDIRGGQDRIYSTPGKEGDVWLAAFDGLYHSTNGGKTFFAINYITEIHGFGFGKGIRKSKYAALYLIGVINGVRGIFRSDDIAKNWVRINADQHQWGLLLHITGDPKKWGRVYVGTHGRGIIYGDPVKQR